MESNIFKIIDHGGERLDLVTVGDREFMQHLVRYKFASRYAKGNILDMACGTGYGTYYLSNQINIKKATGLDISEFSIKRAKHLYSQFADYSIGDATRTHFNDNMFNSIVSMETVEHIENLDDYFSEVVRLLHPNGNLICSVPNKKFYQDAGIQNHIHFNEMYYDEFIRLETYFKNVKIFYQICPIANVSHKSRKNFRLKEFIKRVTPDYMVKLIQTKKKMKSSVYSKYGLNFNSFFDDNSALAKTFEIVEIKERDLFENKMGNFVAVCKKVRQ